MSLDPASLVRKLEALEISAAPPTRYVVALSGGLDSSALLHALAHSAGTSNVPVVAVHIDHGLHAESGIWSERAVRFAASMGVHCESVRVEVGEGAGPEAAARDARYAALRNQMQGGDWLLTAQHQDDQAETLLLNLLRGSGPAGLAAMPSIRAFGPGFLARPLLGTSRAELAAYAENAGLEWTDDPSNFEDVADRNFLRNQVLPVLRERWPDVGARIARSAAASQDAAALLHALADDDLVKIGATASLPVAGLSLLPASRAGNVLRRAVDLAGLPKAPSTCISSILETMLDARDDAEPVVTWQGGECRRFRGHLFLLAPRVQPQPGNVRLMPGKSLSLGEGHGELELEMSQEKGIASELAAKGLAVRWREGGETIRPLGDAHTRKLKKLLQDNDILPWQRNSLPLLYAGGELVAVADLWIDEKFARDPGYRVRWQDRPQLCPNDDGLLALSGHGRSDNV